MSLKSIKQHLKCENCNKIQECKKNRDVCSDFELCGTIPERPKKSRDLCSGCINNYYNDIKEDGCYSYTGSKVELQSNPYLLTQRPPWGVSYNLNCYHKQWR